MARWRGTTTQRGLGSDHIADKKRLLKALRDGEPCWRCGQPMYRSQELDRDHVIDRAIGGASGPAALSHASCNRSVGARAGNKADGRKLAIISGRDVICAACGKPYHYAPRSCEICGQHYHPNHGGQRSCGRTCGVVLARRNRMASGWVPPARRPKTVPQPKVRNCAECGSVFVMHSNGQRFCGRCAHGPWPSSSINAYICRYCGRPAVSKATGQAREVCRDRLCQLARLRANNLRTRNGLTKDEADAQMAVIVQAALTRRSSRMVTMTG